MAQTDFTPFIVLGVIGAAAYYAYENGWFGSALPNLLGTTPTTPSNATTTPSNPTNPVTTSTPTSAPTSGAPTQQSTPANLASLLTAAAGSSAQFGLDPDEWSFYYKGLPGRVAIPPDVFNTMLSSAGITDATRGNSVDADYFVGMLNSVGLSGFGNYRGIPLFAIHGGM